MVHCYFKIVLVIGFCGVWRLRLQAHILERSGQQTSLPGRRPNASPNPPP